MHAVLVTVDIKPGRFEEAKNEVTEIVVPSVSQSPGFVRGVWWHADDEKTGYGLVMFESAEAIDQMRAQVDQTPEASAVSIRSVEAGPVIAEA